MMTLYNCIYDHLPNGDDNEWKAFDEANIYTLEGYGFLPIFWLLLYQNDNIQHAKYIQNVDLNDEYAEEDRQYFKADHGDSSYPYLIISQAMGLNHLKERKQQFINLFGKEFLEPYEHFQEIIYKHFPNFILLDPIDSDITENTEQKFKQSLFEYELLGQQQIEPNHKYWHDLKKDQVRFENLANFLFGFSNSEVHEVEQIFYKNPQYIAANTTPYDLPNYLYWIFGIIIGLPTVYAWFTTHSGFYAFITFAVLSAIFSFIAIKLTSKKMRK